MIGAKNDSFVALIELPEYEKGDHLPAIQQALKLFRSLGVNQIAVALPGRAWSLKDPIPPVIDGVGDLRQRALVVTLQDRDTRSTIIYPIEGTEFSEGQGLGPGSGEIVDALQEVVQRRSDRPEVEDALLECLEAGHHVQLAESVVERMSWLPM